MGYCAEPTPEMGPYSVETRSESFRLYGEDPYEYVYEDAERPRHVIHLSPAAYSDSPRVRGEEIGSIEILFEDIPAIRAALDQAEAIRFRPESKTWHDGAYICKTCKGWLDEGDHTHPPVDFSTVMFPAPVPDDLLPVVCKWCDREIIRSEWDADLWVHVKSAKLHDGMNGAIMWGAGKTPCEPDMQSTWATPTNDFAG